MLFFIKNILWIAKNVVPLRPELRVHARASRSKRVFINLF